MNKIKMTETTHPMSVQAGAPSSQYVEALVAEHEVKKVAERTKSTTPA